MGRLFGTDGVRGIANESLTSELALQIGRAAAMVLIKESKSSKPTVLIGRDTRASGDMLEAALTAGLTSVGCNVLSVGVVPTPAVAYLVVKYGCEAGVMISASHNPCEYNGIKIFQKTGYKLDDAIEDEIEAIILDNTEKIPVKLGGEVGNRLFCKTAVKDYVDHVISTASVRFDGLSIALDCANGSASVCAKDIFTGLGAKCLMLSDTPDGTNINENCGSTHPEELMNFVKNASLDLGLAFDGDADRMLAVDENGELVDGDKVIAICSKRMKEEGRLAKNTAVVTVMSNMGFFKFCSDNDIECKKTAVGDRYVLEKMLKEGYNIGGEQSGHVIFLDYASTGDGELSGVQLVETVVKSGKKLSELAKIMKVYPQVLINVNVTPEGKKKYNNDEYIISAVQQAEMELSGDGRVLVRVSGTEPLVRVMLEGADIEQITKLGNEIADVVKERLS
ncbi:MAG: phosphoglucosamine mutase [Acetobacter sp.]|nr:phosphoglucosamine mutase [Bacteroides sp.]MCM1340479.1 phosphoglucosamine mutase [Acetobacter sp.]MCM1433219.1 phosphoglucosamine mutase [Clostridiales bacterium]